MKKVLLALLLCLGLAPAQAQLLRVLAYETQPFFFEQDGEPAGFEYEILQFYAKAKGLELVVTMVPNFEEILPMLERGEGDVAAATMTITPERQKSFDFSSSYFPVRVMIVERRSRTSDSLASLAGSTLATMKATTYEELLTPVPDHRFAYGDSEEDLFGLVADGRATATAVDSAVALTLLPRFPGLHMTLPLSDEQHYGFAVPKGSPLAADLEKHISQLKSSKIYYRLLEKHFGSEAVSMISAARN